MRRTTPRSALAVTLVLTALLAACTDAPSTPAAVPTGDTPAPASSSPSPAPSTAPMTPEQAKQQALEAYLDMHTAFAAAGRAGDPDYPDLRKYTAGSALALLTKGLSSQKKDGVLARGETLHHAEVTALSPPAAPVKAQVQDCMDTRKSALYKPNGDPVPQDKGGFRLALSDLERIDGTWKVTTLAVRAVGSCKL